MSVRIHKMFAYGMEWRIVEGTPHHHDDDTFCDGTCGNSIDYDGPIGAAMCACIHKLITQHIDFWRDNPGWHTVPVSEFITEMYGGAAIQCVCGVQSATGMRLEKYSYLYDKQEISR